MNSIVHSQKATPLVSQKKVVHMQNTPHPITEKHTKNTPMISKHKETPMVPDYKNTPMVTVNQNNNLIYAHKNTPVFNKNVIL